MPQLAIFATDLGWCGLLGDEGLVLRLIIGHAAADDVRAALRQAAGSGDRPAAEADWNPDLRRRLVRYAQGERVEFDGCALAPQPQTEFQRRVLAATRAIGYGGRTTYAELAARAGRPGAARAVGNVMASNRVPIIVPCHRVVAAGGRLGGFSAPQGIDLKRRLLAMEAEASIRVR